MPSLEKLQQSYQGKPFKVLLVNVQEPRQTVKNFLEKENISLKVLFDKFGKVSAQYGVRSHPIKFLIDGQGKLMARGLGYRNWNSEEMNELVKALIQNAGTTPKA